MLRFITRLVLLLVLGILAPGEAAAFAPVRVWPPAASAEKLASWGGHPETAVLRQAATMQAAETQQAASSLGYDFASGRLLAAENIPIKYIGKLDDLKGIPRSQTLLDDLPDLGSARANYYQNSSVLRKALRDGYEIRDASAYRPNLSPDPTLLRPDRTVGQSFLGAERLILDNKNLFLSPSGAYVPR